MNKNQAIGISVGVLAGAAVGGMIGLLFAPQSGKKTRKMIKRELIAARRRAGQYTEDIKEFADDTMDRVKEGVSDVNRKGHAAMNALKN